MLISYCIPVMNRTYDLRKTLPTVIDAAKNSLPVEIVVVDYNSQDDLSDYISAVDYEHLVYGKYTKNQYYHMAHARNLTIRAASGEYIIISSADIIVDKGYFAVIRKLIDNGNVWLHHDNRFVGVLCCHRDELIESGGFDERFEFYGKEDKDLVARLHRRGEKHDEIPRGHLGIIPTPKADKIKNYRPGVSKLEMKKRAKRIWKENIDNEVLVANEGEEWGVWQ